VLLDGYEAGHVSGRSCACRMLRHSVGFAPSFEHNQAWNLTQTIEHMHHQFAMPCSAHLCLLPKWQVLRSATSCAAYDS